MVIVMPWTWLVNNMNITNWNDFTGAATFRSYNGQKLEKRNVNINQNLFLLFISGAYNKIVLELKPLL